MGGGGSILTVPILVYIVKMDAKLAIALSLAIVGVTAFIGSISHYKAGNIELKVAAIFAPFAMMGTFLGAKLSVFLSGSVQLILCAIVMLTASYFMFTKKQGTNEGLDAGNISINYPPLIITSIFTGVLTGIVGVGGGFMIVPALVLLTKIPMKKSVGTSLLVIAFNSLSGFTGYLGQFEIPWNFLIKFSVFTSLGILLGSYLVKYIPGHKLKKYFAVFLVIMGIFILYKNINTLIV